MGFPLKHNTVIGRPLNSSTAPEEWSTPNWNYMNSNHGFITLGATADLDANFDGVNVANELVQSKWLRIGASSGSYSDYNFLNSGETKFTCAMIVSANQGNYTDSVLTGIQANHCFGTRQVILDHTDDHNDSGQPADGFLVYVKPSSTGATEEAMSFYVNIMGTEVKFPQPAYQFSTPLSHVLAFSYDSSLGSDNIKALNLPTSLAFAAGVFASTTVTGDEEEVVSVTGNPIIGRAKQQVVYGTNNIVKIVADGTDPATVTFGAQHRSLRRGTQITISGSTNFNGAHTVLDSGLGMTTCEIANASGHATEGSDGSPLNATWAYRTYEPLLDNRYGDHKCQIKSLAFWDNVAADADELANIIEGHDLNVYNANLNLYNFGNIVQDKLYSWHVMGGGLENYVFDTNNNKIYNMSAVGGWQRNIVDRDISTDFESTADYNPVCGV